MKVLANDKLRLIITGACNLNCFYCHNEGQAKEEAYLTAELFEGLISAFQTCGLSAREITISGGEPLLHPQLHYIIQKLSSVTDNITMVSNGTLLDDKLVQQLREAGLRKLRLGVDSLESRKPRPSPGFLVKSFNLQSLLEHAACVDLSVELNVVLTRFNERNIRELIELALQWDLNVKFFEHVDVNEYGGPSQAGVMASKPQVPFLNFKTAVEMAVGQSIEFTPSVDLGEANLTTRFAGIELRYCRYLCEYNSCWVTGSRVDARGFTYNCMVNRGIDRISSEMAGERILQVIATASARPCRSRSLQELLGS